MRFRSNSIPLLVVVATTSVGGTGVAQPQEDPMVLQTLCTSGNGESCNDLGTAYQRGTNVAKDLAKAATLYR